MWFLYEVLFLFGLLLYVPGAVWRKRLPHRGWTMRLGRYPTRVVESLRGRRSIWLHAVSVGEVLAAQPLVRALAQAYPEDPLVVSTITPSGFEVASEQLGDRCASVYFPLDLRRCVARALDTLRPRLLLLMESELWPTVIRLTAARGVPMVVINGRLSPHAFERYQWIKPLVARMLGEVDHFLMQSQADADRLLQLGARAATVHVVGSLKWDASLKNRPAPQAIQEAAARIGLNGREVVIVAGSTHRGEERVVLEAFQVLRSAHPNARLIIAPRHMERLAEVEGLIRHAGLIPVKCSQAIRETRWEVGLVDTFGQLPLYYGLASVVFIGGSLIPHGGQNPLEAASLGRPMIFGPSMHNFEAITHQLLAHRAARQLTGGEGMALLFQELLAHPAQAQDMGRRAQELTEQFHGATQRTLAVLKPLLD